MKKIILSGLLLICSVYSHAQKAAPVTVNYPGFAVIELFTSQGCSTCPPADKVLSEIIADADKNHKPVYAISFHVDYWNKLGWKDPYSSFRYTKRQQNYASILAEDVYTPWLIVNGRIAMTGSDKQKATEAINKNLNAPSSANLNFDWMIANDTIILNYDVKYTNKKGVKSHQEYISVVVTERGLSNPVKAGENKDKVLKHDNVARLFETSDLVSPKGTLKIPVKGIDPKSNRNILVFIQDKTTRQILGAAEQKFVQ